MLNVTRPEWEEAITPCYIVYKEPLVRNLEVLRELQTDTGVKVLLAQKCFSMYHFYPLIGEYLAGASSSGLFEARLAYEEMKKEVHVFSPAYRPEEMDELSLVSSHIIFNSFGELKRHREAASSRGASLGLRLNPEHSTQKEAIYDPCAPGSRLGVRFQDFRPHELEGVSGFHMHTLCEQGADALEETVEVLMSKFGFAFYGKKWLNLGGGHHITKEGYDLPRLKNLLCRLQDKYKLDIYLEPGEAVALDSGVFVTRVLDISGENVILDGSAACHAPDVLEMPYRPPVFGGYPAYEKPYTYRLGGPTCLASDSFGTYSFSSPLREGSLVAFGDMAIYTMVKNNSFNGMNLPNIYAYEDDRLQLIKSFNYQDFKHRL